MTSLSRTYYPDPLFYNCGSRYLGKTEKEMFFCQKFIYIFYKTISFVIKLGHSQCLHIYRDTTPCTLNLHHFIVRIVYGIRQSQYISTIFVFFGLRVLFLARSLLGKGVIWPASRHDRRCGGRRESLSYILSHGFSPNANAVAKAIENRPQSTPSFCCWTGIRR